MFDKILQIKHHLRFAALDGERVFVLGERERFMLLGRPYVLAAPLIDGKRTIADILAKLEGQASPAEILYALLLLEEQGHVVTAGATLTRAGSTRRNFASCRMAGGMVAEKSIV